MSLENVEIVRRYFEARNQGDWETVRACAAPDIEYDLSRSVAPWVGMYRGFDAIERLWDEMSEAFGDYRWEAEEFIDAGDAVVVPARFCLTGRDSGIETVSRAAGVYWVTEGKVARFALYQSRTNALEAAGLSE
jgi:ketosteroid isomerase-like protein